MPQPPCDNGGDCGVETGIVEMIGIQSTAGGDFCREPEPQIKAQDQQEWVGGKRQWADLQGGEHKIVMDFGWR